MADVMVKWRNDAQPSFENERIQTIKEPLDWMEFHTPGQYRARQYEISFTDNLPFTVIAMEEEVELLGS
jgi:hypothetical protein